MDSISPLDIFIENNVFLLKYLLTALIGSIFSISIWYLKKLVTNVEEVSKHQIEFNNRLVKMETKIVAELEYLKLLAVQLESRIAMLEKRDNL